MVMRVLILGGTSDATELAVQVAKLPAVQVISSLAGRTRTPTLPQGQVRVGGFGGIEGLVEYLKMEQIDGLIDATHPFAAQITWHAATAAQHCQIPFLMLHRPAWQPVVGDRWIEVASHEEATTVLPELAQRIFLTIGRQELAVFAHLSDLWFLMRMIDPPQPPIPPGELLLERGPFTLAHEQALLTQYQIEAIVSKNSGGDATYAKIQAARAAGLPVVMVQRPLLPEGDRAINAKEAIDWLTQKLRA